MTHRSIGLPFLLAGILAGVLTATIVTVTTPRTYSASVDINLVADPGATSASAYDGALLAQQRVRTYAQFIPGYPVTEEVAQRLALPMTPNDLAPKISVFSQPETTLITATVTDESAYRAAAIANAIGTVFIELVADLERPATDTRTQAVIARQVTFAAASEAVPVSPSLPLNQWLGAAVGLSLGMLVSWWRARTDRSIRSAEQLRRVSGLPVVGVVPRDHAPSTAPLAVVARPTSRAAEAYRRVRTNLQYVDATSSLQVVVVSSPEPGGGTAPFAANLAASTASIGKRVLLVEGNLRTPAISDLLGLDESDGLSSLLSKPTAPAGAIRRCQDTELSVLPAGPVLPNPSELLASSQLPELFRELRQCFDIIVVDTPPVLQVADAAQLASTGDGALLLCRYGRTTEDMVLQAFEAFEAVSARLIGTVLVDAPVGPWWRKYGPDAAQTPPHPASTPAGAAAHVRVPAPLVNVMYAPPAATPADPSGPGRERSPSPTPVPRQHSDLPIKGSE